MQRKSVKFRRLSVLGAGLCALLLGAALRTAVAAEEPIQVETQLVAEVREVSGVSGGRETYRFVPATTLSQGQVVYYTVRIINRSPLVANNVAVVQRIPANTSYLRGSAAGPGAEIAFSADGAQSFASVDRLTVNVEGKAVPAQPEQYTHIRWQLRNPLAPGAVALARFRAVFR